MSATEINLDLPTLWTCQPSGTGLPPAFSVVCLYEVLDVCCRSQMADVMRSLSLSYHKKDQSPGVTELRMRDKADRWADFYS